MHGGVKARPHSKIIVYRIMCHFHQHTRLGVLMLVMRIVLVLLMVMIHQTNGTVLVLILFM